MRVRERSGNWSQSLTSSLTSGLSSLLQDEALIGRVDAHQDPLRFHAIVVLSTAIDGPDQGLSGPSGSPTRRESSRDLSQPF